MKDVQLSFFLVKLAKESPADKPVTSISLRFKHDANTFDLSAREQLLKAFCFPFGPEGVKPRTVFASEEYTFTLTDGDGSRYQGFCRKVLPAAPAQGSRLRYPQVLCMLSEMPWCTFFFKVSI
jgi:hypothetical protein